MNGSASYWVLQAGVEVAMAEEYLTDDEQLEAVKRAFSEYAPWILGGVVLGVGGCSASSTTALIKMRWRCRRRISSRR